MWWEGIEGRLQTGWRKGIACMHACTSTYNTYSENSFSSRPINFSHCWATRIHLHSQLRLRDLTLCSGPYTRRPILLLSGERFSHPPILDIGCKDRYIETYHTHRYIRLQKQPQTPFWMMIVETWSWKLDGEKFYSNYRKYSVLKSCIVEYILTYIYIYSFNGS